MDGWGRMRSSFSLWILGALTLLLSLVGCSSGVVPPGPFVAQETARSIGAGRTRVDATTGGGFGACCGWPGGGVGGQVRVRHGIADEVELGASAAAAWYGGYHDFEWVSARPGPLSVAAQFDVKLTLESRVALVFNGGGGMTPVGAFATGAIAMVVGPPVPKKVEPYGQLRFAFSSPMGPTGFIPDELPGTVEPAAYVLGAAGTLVHITSRTALAFELGGGGIFSREPGGAFYSTFGVQLALGDRTTSSRQRP
jgi:hypothetical protein